ncbi:class I SAM-dependent methyltransferase [Paenibacillus sp. JX-17]|uniref:Class I SAM-dependent methyltransferase n=1 Tax=Paenibacillus lacisoli TaxID=3064525 RepID=A0ABT9CCF0_9BACL|nr:class I SAM-dependent methyltransferase [Paenibacillus sp. JX-17]MDO7906936.1 class I SAM-dependent methyltransferase [Paenibacillus sp. JX-17]
MESGHQNQQAWNSGAYQAWLHRFGTPEEAAAKIKADPAKRVGSALQYMGEIRGKKIVNLLGSNGNKGIALALLGGEVTIVDFSEDNKVYAEEMAAAAGVKLDYVLADVLQLPETILNGTCDVAFMEFGILHYFQDLQPLFEVVAKLLRSGGTFVLQDFHPVSTKLISSRGTTANIRKHKVTGDYFDSSLHETEVSFYKFLPEEKRQADVQKVQLRHWTLGEIVTAVAAAGLFIQVLEELPNQSSDVFDKGIPKTFTLTARKL